ncbi:MAG: CD225/dispanin family protein [Muribaculaceae bacterium]
MKYWVVIKQGSNAPERKGPMSLEELKGMDITAETYVWHEGLDKWVVAATLPELSDMFAAEPPAMPEPPVEPQPVESQPALTPEPAPQPQPQLQPQPSLADKQAEWYPYGNSTAGDVCPPTYLALAIFSLACCFWPLGIVAIVYASKVKSLFLQRLTNEARDASNKARMWSIIAIAVGLVINIITFCIYFIPAMSGISSGISPF